MIFTGSPLDFRGTYDGERHADMGFNGVVEQMLLHAPIHCCPAVRVHCS